MWDKEQTQALLTYAIANFGVFGEPISWVQKGNPSPKSIKLLLFDY